ncbi:MAG: Rieske (2Fe-2S) protein [candidate division Zixibacteria bacterium]|nr:Rieske (2Fe-2S) protein [candidate division Zixibacteria bacterium]
MYTISETDHISNNDLVNPQRRSFLSKALAAISLLFTGFVLYPMLQFLKQPLAKGGTVNRVTAAKISEMTNDSAKIFRFGDSPAMLVRTPEGELKAFTAVCTHLDCTVQYVKGKRHILCACHNGKYDLNGQVLSGPPPRPLEEFKVFEEGEDIIVSRT